jgi:hypothetical protein
MANSRVERSEGYPSITARAHWRRYAAGMATEVVFILALAGAGLVMAVIAAAIWK